jgi:hypothetical protein
MGLVLSAILLVLLVVLFIRDIRPQRAPLVFVLRIVSVILMALVLLGYVFQRTVRVRPGVDLLILADESQSMGLSKKRSEATEALTTLPRKPQWRVAYYGFGDTVRKLADARNLAAEGRQTNLVQALKFAQDIKPGAAVLVSDGEHNAAGDPAQTARKLGFPVYTIGIGRKPVRDVAVERIRSTNRAVVGDTIPLIVRLLGRGFGDERMHVRLTEDGKLVETREVTLGKDETRQELEFRVVATAEGRHLYRVAADSMIGEDNYNNNQRQMAILVVPARTRVVYVTNRPGFNTRFLLQLARTNRDIDLMPFVALTPGRLQRITATGLLPLAPGSFDADVMILDNVDETELGGPFSDAVNSFATNHGVLVLAGERFRAGRALNALLPLEPTNDRIVRDLQLELTEEGRNNPVFFDGARNLLAELPPFWGAVRGKGLHSDAQLWAKAGDGTPLIAFRRSGQGKVLEIAGYPLWRSGFTARTVESGRGDLSRILSNAIRFLALKDVDRFRLSSDKLDYYVGEPVSVLLQATSDDGRPWIGLDVRLSVNDGKASQAMVERGNGLYEGVLEGLVPGKHTARAEVFHQERPQGTTEHEFTVSELSLELSQAGLNDDFLRRIAQASGGEYVPYDSLSPRKPDIRFADYRRVMTFDPRLNRWLFLLIATLLVVEIFIRKRRGMQ